MRISFWSLCIFLAPLLFTLWGCESPTKPDLKVVNTTNVGSSYVGSAACKSCHQSICESYSQHPMCISTRTVDDDDWQNLAHNTPAIVKGQTRLLQVSESGSSMIHSEQMIDADGILIYEQPHLMKYVVGSGSRARAYLEQRSQKLFMSPLNWYRRTQNWGLAPNYRPDDVRRFDRVATEECLNCHTGRIERTAQANGSSTISIKEASIGCERCHGPGSEHISLHERGELSKENDPIKNPANFGNTERDDLCYQCHLAASARVPHPGKAISDYQPGMKLTDVLAILDVGTDIQKGQRTRSVNHVQQMRDSVCFTKSDGQLRCTSCHNPHEATPQNQAIQFYRSKCQQCHQPESCSASVEAIQSRSNDCVACHMPKLQSSNMAHVAQSDHRILKLPIEERPSEDSVLLFFADSAKQLSQPLRQRALAIGTFIHCVRKGLSIPDGLKEFMEKSLADFPQDVLLLTSLGTIERTKQNTRVARQLFEKAISLSPSDEAALDGLLEIAYSQRDWPTCIQCTTKQIQLDPSNVRAYAIRGDAQYQLGQKSEAIIDLEQAAKLNPGEQTFRQWLIEKHREINNEEAANTHQDILKRLQSVRPQEL